MKYSVMVLLALALLAVVEAAQFAYPRGCIYVNGRCWEECPVGTHGYSVGCGVVTPEATCANPSPAEGNSETDPMICDFSACYCDPPTVRDEKNDKCVPLEKCPKDN